MGLLTKRQAAAEIGCSVRTLNDHIASGSLPVHRLSARMTRISPDDLAAFLVRRRGGSAPAHLTDDTWNGPGFGIAATMLVQLLGAYLTGAGVLPPGAFPDLTDTAMHALEEMGIDGRDKAAAYTVLSGLQKMQQAHAINVQMPVPVGGGHV